MMASDHAVGHLKQGEKTGDGHTTRQQKSELPSGGFQAPLVETPFKSAVLQHAALLASAGSNEELAGLVVHFQRIYGNHYVQRLLKAGSIQSKLTVSSPDDAHEREADVVAQNVVRSMHLQAQRPLQKPGAGIHAMLGVLQRVPLHPTSQIDYDATQNRMTFGDLAKDITTADYGTLSTAIQTLITGHVDEDSIDKELRKYFSGASSRLGASLMAKQWHQIASHIAAVNGRRAANRAQLEAQGLLQPADTFQAIELTGADPHKGGETTLFERYVTGTGETKKIVYKPGDLTPEMEIYGDQFRVAQFGGTYAAPTGPAGVADVHGYMAFLKEAGPSSAADVAGIYHSLGEGAALAYVYGLRDLHQENYIMMKDHIQWIDLEAMTGTFETFLKAEMTRTVFESVMNKMLRTLSIVLEPSSDAKFKGARKWWRKKGLANGLEKINVGKQIKGGFEQKRHAIGATAGQAATWATRFVPFPTEQLYELVNEWHSHPELDANPFPPTPRPGWYTNRLDALKDRYQATNKQEVDDMFKAQTTRDAIRRGDIPFFIRKGSDICDESGNTIVHNSTHERLRNPATSAQINARRTGPVPDALDYVVTEANRQHLMLIAVIRGS